MKILRNFSMFYGKESKDQNLLASQMSCDFAEEIVDFQKMIFQKLEEVIKR